LKDEDPHVRIAAAEALGSIGRTGLCTGAVVPTLVAALRHEDLHVRVAAAEALGSFGPGAKDAVSALVKALEDEGGWFGEEAATALIAIGGEAVAKETPQLVEILKRMDHSFPAVATVIGSLGAGAKEAVPVLMEALAHESLLVQTRATIAIRDLGPAAEEAVAVLTDCLRDGHPWVRMYAAEALGRIGPSAVSAVPALIEMLEGDTVIAARALGEMGPSAQDAVPALKKLLMSEDARVRESVEEALRLITAEPAQELE
jgi:HEAT repeat protein